MTPDRRPLVLVDLDDTLFQTARKMDEDSPRFVAAEDARGVPNSYMTPVQRDFARWLFSSSDVVPVTARSVEAYGRVRLPFTCGAVCSHGGVILGADGGLDREWHAVMAGALGNFQERLPMLCDIALQMGGEMGFSVRGWVVAEDGLNLYAVLKQNTGDDAVLAAVLEAVRKRGLLEGMRVHANGNNLAFLPEGLDKRLAVREWLRRDREVHGERPVLGFGDSLTDLGFMGECHLWGTPAKSQVAKALERLP